MRAGCLLQSLQNGYKNTCTLSRAAFFSESVDLGRLQVLGVKDGILFEALSLGFAGSWVLGSIWLPTNKLVYCQPSVNNK